MDNDFDLVDFVEGDKHSRDVNLVVNSLENNVNIPVLVPDFRIHKVIDLYYHICDLVETIVLNCYNNNL